MWLSFLSLYADKGPMPPQAYLWGFLAWTLLVTFATSLITRLWDLSLSALARRRTAGRRARAVSDRFESSGVPRATQM
jgi:hypothetical protein